MYKKYTKISKYERNQVNSDYWLELSQWLAQLDSVSLLKAIQIQIHLQLKSFQAQIDNLSHLAFLTQVVSLTKLVESVSSLVATLERDRQSDLQ